MSDNNWTERLDAAVKQQFPEVECETEYGLFSMRYVSRWWQAGTEDTKLKPALARQVKAFVAGFMASEESRLRTTDKPLRFVIYRDSFGEWRWKLVASNGKIIGDSGEGYKRRATMLKQVEHIRRDAAISTLNVQGRGRDGDD